MGDRSRFFLSEYHTVILMHNIFDHIIIMFSVIVLLQRTNYVVGWVHIHILIIVLVSH